MTTTKTSTATAAAVNKPPSLAENVAMYMIYIAILAFPIQGLFNACIADVYDFKEMSYRLAFLCAMPLIVITNYIMTQVNRHFYYEDLKYRELLTIRQLGQYQLEYTVGTYNKIDQAMTAMGIQEPLKPVDTEQNLS
jgi:hypothetical protein